MKYGDLITIVLGIFLVISLVGIVSYSNRVSEVEDERDEWEQRYLDYECPEFPV